MNYVNVVKNALEIAIQNEGINMAIDQDLYQINNFQETEYPVFVAIPTEPQIEHENYMEFHLTFYYIDRIQSANNEYYNPETALIHSTGITILSDIVRRLRKVDGILDITNEISYICWTDTEVLSDRCNGVYCNVTILTAKEITCD